MKNITSKELKEDYNSLFCKAIQKYTHARATKMSQQDVANKIGVSLKTIQRFENYQTQSGYLLYAYKRLFNY